MRAPAHRGDTLASVWLGLGIFAVYLPSATYSRRLANDVIATLVPAWHLVHSGTLRLDDWPGHLTWGVLGQGHLVSNRFPGAVLFSVPFYAIFGGATSGDPTFPATVFPASLAAATAAAAACACLFLVFSRLVDRGTAVGATLIAAFATSTWSVSADALWTHGPDQLWLSFMLLAASAGAWWLTGCWFALSILTRPHLAVASAAVGLLESRRRRSLSPAVKIGFGSLCGLFALLVYNRLLFGSWSILGGYTKEGINSHGVGMTGFLLNIAGTLASPERGVLVLSPFLLLLLPGLRVGWQDAPGWVRSASVGGVAYLAVQLWLNRFSGGSGFYSYRLPIEMLTLAAPLLLFSYLAWTSQRRWRRLTFQLLVAVSVFEQFFGSFVYHQRAGNDDPWSRFLLVDAIRMGGPLIAAAASAVLLAAVAAIALRIAGQSRSRTPPSSEIAAAA